MKRHYNMLLFGVCAVAMSACGLGCTKRVEEDPLGRTIVEGAFFLGGYGIDFLIEAGRELEMLRPDVKANVWGNPRSWEQIFPRLIAGNPPDVMDGVTNMSVWDLVADGGVLDLNDLMEKPAYGQEQVKFKDTFFPGVLEDCRLDTLTYFLPLTYVAYGFWYDKTLFDENSWTVPSTWDGFLDLCDSIKANGIAPITYQGRYPGYFLIVFRALVYKIAGEPQLVDMDNLVPGAWERPEVIRAARMIQELAERDYIQEGAASLTHTEAQMEWLAQRAAMVPCGTWLENEMRDVIPEGFQIRMMPIPAVEGGVGPASAIEAIATPNFFVPRDAQHPELGKELLRILLSKKTARKFAETIGDIIPITGAADEADISPTLRSVLKSAQIAAETFNMKYSQWYEWMNTETGNFMGDLLARRSTPEEFTRLCEREAQRVRDDDALIKHKRRL